MKLLKNNGLTIALLALFALSLVGQTLTGFHDYDDQLVHDGQAPLSFAGYLASGAYIEAVFENWESEFLQMGMFVVLTAFLFQKGSPESKKIEEDNPEDEDPVTKAHDPRAPWPVRAGGVVLAIYKRSLSFALFSLFLVSFALHGYGGAREYNREQLLHGEPIVSFFGYFATSRFWFESFQNWQSEFLSVAAIVVLGIRLRQHGSPESKPVAAPHDETGH